MVFINGLCEDECKQKLTEFMYFDLGNQQKDKKRCLLLHDLNSRLQFSNFLKNNHINEQTTKHGFSFLNAFIIIVIIIFG